MECHEKKCLANILTLSSCRNFIFMAGSSGLPVGQQSHLNSANLLKISKSRYFFFGKSQQKSFFWSKVSKSQQWLAKLPARPC